MSDASRAAMIVTSAFEDYQRGDLAGAGEKFGRAIALDSGRASAHLGAGVTAAALGRLADAIEHLETALELDPASVDAARCLAQAALHVDRLDTAERALETALAIETKDPTLHAMHAETLASTGRHEQAFAAASRWRSLAPHDATAHRATAELARELGRNETALDAYRSARAIDASSQETLAGLAACFETARFAGDDPQAARELETCLREPGVDTQRLARTAGNLLCARYEIDAGSTGRPLDAWLGAGWPEDALLRALLERTVNVDPLLERVFTAQRAALAAIFAEHGHIPGPWTCVAGSMAVQACASEHVWPTSEREKSPAATASEALAATNASEMDSSRLADAMCIAALYAPLDRLANATMLEAAARDIARVKLLVRRALSEPLCERAMAQHIPRAQLSDSTSLAVQAQYEQSPYPRWVDLPPHQEIPAPEQLRWAHPAFRQAPCFDGPLRVLIAGCGTGRHALRVARREREGEVLAIDLSIASIAHAARKARELEIANINFRQLDILDAGELGEQFPIIESFGVLHHMRDPSAGLASLVSCLMPGGIIKLGLYSRRARRAVTAARARIAELGIGQSPAAVRAFRARVAEGLEPALESLLGATDFYSTSACRDLLFHVREVQYTPLELRTLLDGAGVKFLGFQLRSRQIETRYREQFPQDAALTDLENWDEFEQQHPDTFPNTFEFWCQKRLAASQTEDTVFDAHRPGTGKPITPLGG